MNQYVLALNEAFIESEDSTDFQLKIHRKSGVAVAAYGRPPTAHARISSAGHYNKMMGKAKVKRLGFRKIFIFPVLAVLFLFPTGAAIGQDTADTSKKAEEPAPKSELDNLKAEWEAVREQQIQMIREKEDQLEKLKEEIFAKMKVLNTPAVPQSGASQPAASNAPGLIPQGGAAVPANSSELEAQKAAFQAERQKFFNEMNRQKESLRQLQSSLDEKAKQLEAERESFERAKNAAVR